MAIYAIRAYLLPCNHRKACQETKWMIRDRAPLANSKQISMSIEAPLNSGTSCMVRMANGPQLTTLPFWDQRCVHASRQDRPLCLTLIVSSSAEKHFWCQNNKRYIPILREILVTLEYPDLRMSFNYRMGQNRDNKRAQRGTKLPYRFSQTLLRSIMASIAPVTHGNSTA